MSRTKLVAGGLAVAALAAAGIGLAHRLANRGAEAPVGAPARQNAPELGAAQPDAVGRLMNTPLTGTDGKPYQLATYRGQVLVVNFWASWCAPCVREMPTLAGLAHRYAGKGVRFVGIGVDSEKNVQAFLQKTPVNYPIFVSGFGGADLARSFGNTVGALPFTVVIDANGAVRSTKLGEVVPGELERTLDAI